MEHTLWLWPHWFWLVPFLLMILMCVFACRMFRRANKWRQGAPGGSGPWSLGCCGSGKDAGGRWSSDSPDKILDQRYARGEITREQYEQMKRDLKSPPTPDPPTTGGR